MPERFHGKILNQKHHDVIVEESVLRYYRELEEQQAQLPESVTDITVWRELKQSNCGRQWSKKKDGEA